MPSVKVSVSLPSADVTFIDDYSAKTGIASRSAVMHQAIELLRGRSLEEAYAAAWSEWEASPDAALWDATAGDGIADAAR